MISNKIEEARKRTSFSKAEVARRLGIPYTTYNGYETGKRTPKPEMLAQIADILGTDTNILLDKPSVSWLIRQKESLQAVAEWIAKDIESLTPGQKISFTANMKRLDDNRDLLTVFDEIAQSIIDEFPLVSGMPVGFNLPLMYLDYFEFLERYKIEPDESIELVRFFATVTKMIYRQGD